MILHKKCPNLITLKLIKLLKYGSRFISKKSKNRKNDRYIYFIFGDAKIVLSLSWLSIYLQHWHLSTFPPFQFFLHKNTNQYSTIVSKCTFILFKEKTSFVARFISWYQHEIDTKQRAVIGTNPGVGMWLSG